MRARAGYRELRTDLLPAWNGLQRKKKGKLRRLLAPCHVGVSLGTLVLREGRPSDRAKIPRPAGCPSRRGIARYSRMSTTHVSQLARSLQLRERSRNHGCVRPAVHGCQSPWRSASGRAKTRLVWNPCAPARETFQTHVTWPQPWLSLAPTTMRSWLPASEITWRRRSDGNPSAFGEQLTISNPSTPAMTNAPRSS